MRKYPAWLLPVGILAAFGLLFLGLYQDRLLPAPEVPVARVLVISDSSVAEAGDTGNAALSGAPLFQASGWIEPDPFPIKASALIDGVVREVHVLDGEDVTKGQHLVSLVDEDAKLALAAAEARHRMLVSAHAAQLAAIEAGHRKLDASRAESGAAKSAKAEADDHLVRLNRLAKASAVSQSDVIAARLRLQKEESLHRAAQSKEAEFEAEIRRMELEAKVKEDEAALVAVAVDQARLALERTHIHAPISGRVLRLMAAPGDKKMLSMDHAGSSTLCVLYDPERLQVRVDVALTEASSLRVGQRAKIHTSLLGDHIFDGEVTRIAGEADLQRNTLQAKVRILDPVDQLRPDTLCRVEFFTSGNESVTAAQTRETTSLWAPSAALQDDGVWVCDPDTRRVFWRGVQVGGEKRDQYIRILSGLRPGELVLLSPGNWREGQRVNSQIKTP